MESCFFSETQFEAYHSRQLEKLIGSSLPQYFPSRNQEGDNGIDMVHFTNYYSLFFQYKVPNSIKSTYKRCLGLTGNCFRMSIYNRNRGSVKGQYELLWDWATTEPFVFYATPLFHTDKEFYNNYSNLIGHTAHFKFRGNFKDPTVPGFNLSKHYLYYSTASTFGLMYSEEPVKVNLFKVESLLNEIGNFKPNQLDFGSYLIKMKSRITEILFQRKLIGTKELFREELLSTKEKTIDNYFVCNYFLQKYFGLSWTILFHSSNRENS